MPDPTNQQTPATPAASSSSPPAAASVPPAVTAAPAVASAPTPAVTPPAADPAAPPAAPSKIKLGDAEYAEDDLRGAVAFRAAEESRRLSIPAADKYEVKLPADFKAPEGLKVEFKQDDPLIAQARTIANKRGLDQEGFSEFLGLYAATKVGEQQQFKAAFDAEVAKLGVNATARVTAVTTWLQAVGGPDAEALVKTMQYAPVAGTVVAFENLMKKFTSQGGASFTQSGREQGKAPLTDEQWNAMSYSEKRAYGKRDKAA